MRHRIFIAINLPEDIKKQLLEEQAKWPELPARWAKPSNLHITLLFLGYLPDEELLDVVKATKEVSQKHNPFSINLTKVCYGPPQKPYSETKFLTGRRDEVAKRPPRMVWVTGEKSDALGKLQNDLQNALFSISIKDLKEPENRPYAPHINLGRIRPWEFRRIEPEERPEVNEEINLSFEVNSIEVMESELKRGGAEYIILESAQLIDSKNF